MDSINEKKIPFQSINANQYQSPIFTIIRFKIDKTIN